MIVENFVLKLLGGVNDCGKKYFFANFVVPSPNMIVENFV